MAKYKLIKIYPKSPPLGTIVEVGNDGYLTYRMRNDYNQEMTSIHKSVLTEYSEFWEEIVEKDYQILKLSLCGLYNRNIINVSNYSDKYIDSLLSCEGNYICSVKRLSDGEVFTVGDKCKDINTNCFTNVYEITLKNTICFINGVNINYLDKVKQPLFTTEDGVNIYVGDRISTVLLSDMEIFTADGLAGRDTRPVEGFKYFSTKEKAEEYINFRKPYLSNKDVLDEIEKCTNIEQLKKVFTNKVAY